jgi:hypothetical protein
MTTDTMPLNLTPAAVILAVADVIERQGLARGNYYDTEACLPPRQAPVDVLGGIAIACGLDPRVWEDDGAWTPAFRAALDAADFLVDAFALDHDESYAEALGRWSDKRDAATVIAELSDAALEVLTS